MRVATEASRRVNGASKYLQDIRHSKKVAEELISLQLT